MMFILAKEGSFWMVREPEQRQSFVGFRLSKLSGFYLGMSCPLT